MKLIGGGSVINRAYPVEGLLSTEPIPSSFLLFGLGGAPKIIWGFPSKIRVVACLFKKKFLQRNQDYILVVCYNVVLHLKLWIKFDLTIEIWKLKLKALYPYGKGGLFPLSLNIILLDNWTKSNLKHKVKVQACISYSVTKEFAEFNTGFSVNFSSSESHNSEAEAWGLSQGKIYLGKFRSYIDWPGPPTFPPSRLITRSKVLVIRTLPGKIKEIWTKLFVIFLIQGN